MERYSRQIKLQEIGPLGQEKIANSKVTLIGAGALANSCAPYLIAAGVGEIQIIDDDIVEVHNLQRQIFFTEKDAKEKKIQALEKRLHDLNSQVKIITHNAKINTQNIKKIIKDSDVVCVGPDNFAARYLTNFTCRNLGIPQVIGSVSKWQGQVQVVHQNEGACFQCLFPQYPHPTLFPSCSGGGVIGPLTGIIGSFMALETIKLILNLASPSSLLMVDTLKGHEQRIELLQNEECTSCQNANYPFQDIDVSEFSKIKEKSILVDVREEHEREIVHIGGIFLPLSQLEKRWEELLNYKDKSLYILCHHGVRSAYVCNFLHQKGFKKLFNISGGIHRWTEKVDSQLPTY